MIFYFSGTGNTRWAAETVAAALGEPLVDIAEVLRVRGEGDTAIDYALLDDERIGFFYPVHGWQPPAIVRKFISRLRISSPSHPPYVYALCTCGDTVGDAMTILSKDLAARNLTLRAAFSLIMPESYVCLPFMYTDTPEREKEKKDKAAEMLKDIIFRINDNKDGMHLLKTGPTPRLYSYVIGAYFNRFMITDKKFTVDVEKCIGCGKCVKVCPTGNIREIKEIKDTKEDRVSHSSQCSQDSYPSWLHDGSCTCCLACYHHCPTHAINYGSITKKRGQYYFK